MKLMIFGAGFSGCAIAEKLKSDCDFIGGTTRNSKRFPSLKSNGITPFQFDGETFSPSLISALEEVTHLVQSISPDEMGDPVLPILGRKLREYLPKLEWVGYLSTVGVYGHHDGAWVDETTPCKPVSKRSVARLNAENDWQSLCRDNQIPLAILRLSGIYGPGRNAFVNFDKGKARRLIKKGQVFNRIFVDDIAGATKLLASRKTGGIFNITDDEPAPPQDVVTYAAKLMGIAPPPEINFETADLSPMARSFYGENKRVSNTKIKQLGYDFQKPNYRIALEALFAMRDDNP